MTEVEQIVYWSPAQVRSVESLDRYLKEYLGTDVVGIAELARNQDPDLVSRLQAILLVELPYDGQEDWIRESIRFASGLVEVQRHLDARLDVANMVERLVTGNRAYAEWVNRRQRESDERNPGDVGHD